ncbi:MAG TPA: hypothetical protein ENJ71_03770 [Epsilonproteobacteria bacterium]|nr:hypothetical protein [Campylobacterota bacterium]
MKHIKTLSTLAMTGMAAVLATGVTGCGQKPQEEQQQAKGAFVVIEETAPGKYKIKDEFPSDETRIILKKLDGTEKVLTKEEMDALVKQEAAKIDNGTSALTQPDAQMQMQGGMGLGEAILASAAGAIIGSWIGSKLFGNQNYQNNRKAGYKSPSTYQRSKNSFSKARKSTTKRSGFFGNNKKNTTRSGGFFGG